MTEDNWYQDSDDAGLPSDADAYAAKPGMSTGKKVLIGVLIAGSMMLLLCCGGVFYFTTRVMNMMTDDPARIQEIQQKIAGIDLPEEWEPKAGVAGGMFGFNVESAVYEKGDAVFMLMQFDVPGQISEEQMREQFEQGMQQQGRNTKINVESKEARTLTVAGEETTLEFVKGTTQDGEEVRQVRQVTGTFSGRGGPAFLLYHAPEEDWDEEQVVELIESIKK